MAPVTGIEGEYRWYRRGISAARADGIDSRYTRYREGRLLSLAKAFTEAAGVPLDHADPEPDEARGYNPMECSALDSSKLRSLGWEGHFPLSRGVARTVELLAKTIF